MPTFILVLLNKFLTFNQLPELSTGFLLTSSSFTRFYSPIPGHIEEQFTYKISMIVNILI